MGRQFRDHGEHRAPAPGSDIDTRQRAPLGSSLYRSEHAHRRMTSMSIEITRREFIVTNLAASLAALAEKRIDQQLSNQERRTMLAMARTIFPHDQAADAEYTRAIAIMERT